MKAKKARLLEKIMWGILWLLIGILLAVASIALETIRQEPYLRWIILGLGALMTIVSAICIAIFAGQMESASKKQSKAEEKSSEEALANKQALESKLAQIDMMDDVQFVMYVSRLFQGKGYAVRMTPTYNNYGVSFIAQTADLATAVICARFTTVTEDDIRACCADWNKYPCKYATFVTNGNLDKKAKRFVAKNDICVIDRLELTKQ